MNNTYTIWAYELKLDRKVTEVDLGTATGERRTDFIYCITSVYDDLLRFKNKYKGAKVLSFKAYEIIKDGKTRTVISKQEITV